MHGGGDLHFKEQYIQSQRRGLGASMYLFNFTIRRIKAELITRSLLIAANDEVNHTRSSENWVFAVAHKENFRTLICIVPHHFWDGLLLKGQLGKRICRCCRQWKVVRRHSLSKAGCGVSLAFLLVRNAQETRGGGGALLKSSRAHAPVHIKPS